MIKPSFILLSTFLLLSLLSHSQLYKISGIILDNKKERLPLASVEIKELKKGTVSKDDGSYEFYLERGKYDLVVSMIGYKTKLVTFYINNTDVSENVELEPDESASMQEVIIKAKLRDRAEEIIKNVIRNKETVLDAIGSYSCNAYIRAFQLDSNHTKKKDGDTTEITGYDKMAMTEVVLHVDRSASGQIKEERIAVNKRGNSEDLFYLTATDGDFFIYDNLIKAPPVSRIPFVSPLSYSGLLAYRFKTLKIDRTIKPKVYTIAIRPRQLSNATIEGEITIQDSTWNVMSVTFRLPPAHMPEYDYMEVKQEYDKIGDSARVITRQQFTYYTKTKKGKIYGETTVRFSDYQLRRSFRRGHFGLEVSSTSQEAYEKDSTFWKSVRTEPLSRQQELYARYQDSIARYMKSEAYLDSIDRVLNKVTWQKMLIFGQIFNDHKKERMWILPPITTIIQPIAFGGARLKLSAAYRKTYASRKTLNWDADISYGFRNRDVNGSVGLQRKYNPFNTGQFGIRAGRNFEFIYPGDAWVNVLKRSNIYLNTSLEASHELQIVNGVHLQNKFEIAFRRSVAHFKVGNNADSIFGIPNEPPVEFEPYNAPYYEIKLFLTPGLRYIREPREKIFLGSKWPTFYITWRKGVPKLFKSKIDFDYLEFGLIQSINLGVAGITAYNVRSGDFINTKDLRVIDYKFMRQGDPLFFQNPQSNFQALDSTFPVFDRYYQGNLVHEFNGALINKIPFFKKLKLQEIAGGGILIAPERDLRYAEFFAGIERVFKWPFNPLARVKLGVYVVTSVANKFNNPVQVKIGLTTWDRFRNRWR
ncbi:MAG: carboxypeptidase-like regulatory domain-containing protein [Bacteroidetes bacterium]|nr:carboxypeptidase-like regulatory domain-containing protein [Bacteroidota bacterium]